MRAIIVDLDRTLLRTDKTISEYTLDIMRKCHDRGIAIMAATARPERSILQYHQQIGFAAVTTMNGARVILPNAVLENSIPYSSGEEILSKLLALPDVAITVETSDGIYSNVKNPEWNPIYYTDFPRLPTQGALYKILVSSMGGFLPDGFEKILTDDVYHTIANGTLVQIMSKTATKWNGICAMLAALAVPESESIYFGDDNDDIEPIQMCGTGVAVANAIEAVLSKADYVTDSNDEDGVAHFIESKILPTL